MQIACLILMACCMTAQASPVSSSQELKQSNYRLAYGSVFTEFGQIISSGDQYWQHSFQIPLLMPETLPVLSVASVKKCQQSESVSTSSQKRHHIHHGSMGDHFTTSCKNENINQSDSLLIKLRYLQQELVSKVSATNAKIKEMIPEIDFNRFKDLELNADSRSTRAILGFLGNFASSILGLATEDQLEKFKHHILALSERNKKSNDLFLKHENEMASYMKTMNDKVSNAMSAIETNHQNIRDIQTNLDQLVTAVNDNFEVFRLLSQVSTQMNKIDNYLHEIESAVFNLKQGRLTPDLLPSSAIEQAISDIRHQLQTEHPEFTLVYTDPDPYYSMHDFLAVRFQDSLYVSLKFFLTSHTFTLHAYQAHLLSLPLNDSSAHSSRLTNVPSYVILSHNLQYYTTLTVQEMQQCIRFPGSKYHCKFNLPLTHSSKPSCVLGLILNHKGMIFDHCQFSFVPSDTLPQVYEFDSNHLVISNIPSIDLQCSDTFTTIPGCKTPCLVRLPCYCNIQLADFFVPPRVRGCSNNTQLTTWHVPNLQILQSFYDEISHQDIEPDSVFENIPNIPLPVFNVPQHKYSELIAKDSEYNLELSRVIKTVKDEQPIYQTLDQPVLDNFDFDNTSSELDFISIKYLALLISVLNTIAIAYLIFKLRSILPVLLALTTKSSAAIIFPTIHFPTPTTTQPPDDSVTGSNGFCSWLIPVIILQLLTLGFLLITFLKRKPHPGYHKLLLEISNANVSYQIPILNISHGFYNWHIQSNLFISSIQINGLIFLQIKD